MTRANDHRPAILLTFLTGKKADLDLVRRRIGYRRLVLLCYAGNEELTEETRRSEGDDVVHVEPLPRTDAITQLEKLRAIVHQERGVRRKNRIVLNAAGGDPDSVLAMLLLAYEEGHETWFIQEGHHEQLPVLKGISIKNRLDEDEEQVIKALPGDGTTSSDLAQRIILPRTRIENALRRLEQKDLVTLYPQEGRVGARPTSTGKHIQDHLARPGGK